MHPLIAKIAPRKLTDQLVTKPRKNQSETEGQNDRPRCRCRHFDRFCFIGTPEFCREVFHLAPNHVDNSEDHDPNCVYEVPIERQYVNSLGVLLLHLSEKCECHHCRQAHEAHDHVKAVQPDQGVISGSKQVCADRQSLFVDQPMPF